RLRDRQPEAGAAEEARGRRVGLLERPKEPRALLGVEPYSGVAHRELEHHVVAFARADAHRYFDFALRGEFDRVVGIIEERLPARWILSMYPCCVAGSPARTARCAIPMIAFIGVRISWLMLARNCALARFAASATFFASASSAVRARTRASSELLASSRRRVA